MDFLANKQILSRVLWLQSDIGRATGTLVEFPSGCYLLTAAHCVRNTKPGDSLLIHHAKDWTSIRVLDVRFSDNGRDCAAIKTDIPLAGGLNHTSLATSRQSIFQGQYLVYCGFPLGLHINTDAEDYQIPIPLIKSGILSGWCYIGDHEIDLVDSYGNPGFSGGPVLAKDQSNSNKDTIIVGVVSGGYADQPKPVMKNDQNGELSEHGSLYITPQSGFTRFNFITHFTELVALMQKGNSNQ